MSGHAEHGGGGHAAPEPAHEAPAAHAPAHEAPHAPAHETGGHGGGGGNFLSNITAPVSQRVSALYNTGVAKVTSVFSRRVGAAPNEGFFGNPVGAIQDWVNASVTNLLEKGSHQATMTAETLKRSMSAVGNTLKSFPNPVAMLKYGIKSPFAILNEGADYAASTVGNIIKTVHDGIEGAIGRTLDRVSYYTDYLKNIPIAGVPLAHVATGTINVGNKILNFPMDVVEFVRARLGKVGDKIFGFIRGKTIEGGGAAPAEAHAH